MTASSLLRKYRFLIGVFYKQDSQIVLSILPRYIWAILVCVIYRFIFQAALMGKSVSIDQYHLGFPIFLMSGIAWLRLIPFALKSFDEALVDVRKALPVGEVLITPTSLWEIILAHAIWKGFLTVNEVIAVLISSKILLGIPLMPFLSVPILISSTLIILSYMGIGMILSAATLFIKKTDVFFTVFMQASYAFCGVYFPVSLFPQFIQFLTPIIPLTKGLKIIRLSLAGASFDEMVPIIMMLATMAAFFVLIGVITFQRSLDWAKKNGKL